MRSEFIRKKLVEQNFNTLYNTTQDFLQRYHRGPVEPIDFEVIQVYLYSGDDGAINADVEIQLSWQYYSGEYDRYFGDMHYEKLFVSCSLDLDEGFSIAEIDTPVFWWEYERSKRLLAEELLSDLKKLDYSESALRILKEYCPEVFLNPQPVPIEKIIEKLGIAIEVRKGLNADESAIGKTVFDNESAYQSTEKYTTGATIYIDKDLAASSYKGRLRFTMAHELGHAVMHEDYLFRHNNTDKPQLDNDAYSKYGDSVGSVYKTDSNFMEIQANGFAACLLMPKDPFLKKYHEFREEAETDFPALADCVSAAFLKTADFFQVSKEAAKNRLRNLGVAEADGVNNVIYSNNKCERFHNYAFTAGALNQWETFFISFEDYLKVVCENEKLFKLVVENKILYADGHLVLNDQKYVENVEGRQNLTFYALEHMDECAFVFKRVRSSTSNECISAERIGFRNKGKNADYTVSFDGSNQKNTEIAEIAELLTPLYNAQDSIAKTLAEMRGKGFSGAFLAVLKWYDLSIRLKSDQNSEEIKYALREDGSVNYKVAGEVIDRNGKTVKNYLEGKRPNRLLEVLEICDKLCLERELTFELISEYDYDIRLSSKPRDRMLYVVLKDDKMYDSGIENWKQYMSYVGLPLE